MLWETAEIQNLPPTLFNHLLDRITEREISADQLGQFADWLVTEPEVPKGQWFKRFPEMIVRRRRIGEDLSKGRTSSWWRRGALVERKFTRRAASRRKMSSSMSSQWVPMPADETRESFR